jgi:dTDP-4-amino-4,6-dideoxygalactose transaminase
MFDALLSHSRPGCNYRLDELSAAIGFARLKRMEAILAARKRAGRPYTERLSDPGIIDPPTAVTETTGWSSSWVSSGADPALRGNIMRFLETRGIPGRPNITSIHLRHFYWRRFGC